MKYVDAVQYLNSFINYEREKKFPYNELRLKGVNTILGFLGNPHKRIKSIHIAGTKGKGSTAVFIANILKASGYRTGLYTSPHLHDFRERICIDGRLINQKDLTLLTKRLKIAIDKYTLKTNDSPTFFEVYTILAFCYFRMKRINIMVIETGIGGRLDATNVIKPLVCVITSMSYEHMDKLGGTLTKITSEKADIIKRNSVVISANQPKAAERVIRETASKMKAKLFTFSRDISFEEIKFNGNFHLFKVKSIFNTYDNLKTSLLGRHQLINATCSIAAVEALRFYKINVRPLAIKEGISKTKWAGRLEIISKRPLIVLDGAQNKASAKVLKEAILKLFNYKNLVLVLGISQDKDIKGICSVLHKISNKIVLTRADHPRASSAFYLKKFISNSKPVYITENVEDALNLATKKAKEDDLILITGSLFVVAQARTALKVSRDA